MSTTDRFSQMGFVSLDEIQNVFTQKLSDVEQQLFRDCPTLERRADQAYIMTWLDGVRQELMKRAKGNLTHYLENNPKVKQAERASREQEAAAKNKNAYDDRVRLGRTNYARAYGGG